MKNTYQKIKLTTGLILLGIVVFLFLAFNSYWENGIFDQSEIIGESNNYLNTKNVLGGLGATISEFFINIFGGSSYLIISLLALISIKLLFQIKRIHLIKVSIQHMFWIMWISLFFSIIPKKILSGKIGLIIFNKLITLIGQTGIRLFLIIILLIFMVLTFNIDKNLIIKLKSKIKLLFIRSINKFEKKLPSKVGHREERENTDTEITNLNKKIDQLETTNNNEKVDESEIIVEVGKSDKIVSNNNSNNPEIEYKFPELNLLKDYEENNISINNQEVETNKKLIEDTLSDFKIDVKVQRATVGPTITLYEIIPKEGVKISKIKNLENDIALRIKAIGVRIIAPLPGKGTVGIEVPNQNPTIVSMKNVIESEKFQKSKLELPIALGKTISNETFIIDLIKTPHLLIAGATGQGKSVGLNAVLCSILYKKHPDEVKFILVDPKKVELTLYNRIENHFLAKLSDDSDAIITDTKKVVKTLKSLCLEMDERYNLLKKAEVRNVQEYNAKYKEQKLNQLEGHKFLPYLVLVIDEFADLIMTAGKEIEIPIARLAQLSRAIGIHLIIATQRPTTNIITGTIKANFPTRIAFRVIQGIDSKTILDTVGANQLIGRGDMLISTGSSLSRIQCAFIDTSEVESLTNFISQQKGEYSAFILPIDNTEKTVQTIQSETERDPLFQEAALLIIMHQQGSTSMIQRKLKLGYNRAGRIIDQLEDAGVLGALEGSKGRKVLVKTEEELKNMI